MLFDEIAETEQFDVFSLVKTEQLIPHIGVYDIDNLFEYATSYTQKQDTQNNVDIWFPHDLTWYEWKPAYIETPEKKHTIGVLINTNINKLLPAEVYSIPDIAANAEKCNYKGTACVYVNPIPRNIDMCMPFMAFSFDLNEDRTLKLSASGGWRISNLFHWDSNTKTFYERETTDLDRDILGSIFYLSDLTCRFLSCTNVVREEHHLDPKVIKKRRQSGKKNFKIKHYTLQISNIRKIIDQHTKGSRSGSLSQAWHICRGHFKTYSNEHKLFGKYAGTYFWHDHVRGDKQNGMINKRYEIVPSVQQ